MHYISLHPLQSGCYAETPTNRQNDWPLCFRTRENKLFYGLAIVSHCALSPWYSHHQHYFGLVLSLRLDFVSRSFLSS